MGEEVFLYIIIMMIFLWFILEDLIKAYYKYKAKYLEQVQKTKQAGPSEREKDDEQARSEG